MTLGAGDTGPPFLLYSDADSLRVLSLAMAGVGEARPVWAGPGGTAAGRGISHGLRQSLDQVESPGPGAAYLYPNPARDRCTIRIEDYQGEFRIHAFTAGGTRLGMVAEHVRSDGRVAEVEWDVSDLAPGVYHLVLEQTAPIGPGDGVRTIGRTRLTLMVVR